MPKKNVDWIEIASEYITRPNCTFQLIADERGLNRKTVSVNVKKTVVTALQLLRAHRGIE